ncbi:MAG: hypothetical protein ACLVJ6_03625 [Merdibacter sp.]
MKKRSGMRWLCLLGLNAEWDAAVTTLSRGERQRYGLLCACMKQAPLAG